MTKKTKIKFSLFLVFSCLILTTAYAQEIKPDILSQINRIQKMILPGSNENASTAEADSDEVLNFIVSRQLDEKTALTIRSLKNPFINQLPKDVIDSSRSEQPPEPKANIKTSTQTTIPPEAVLPQDLIISGLVWNTDRPQAIINNKIYHVGDMVSSWTISHIDRRGVELSFQGTKIWLESTKEVKSGLYREIPPDY